MGMVQYGIVLHSCVVSYHISTNSLTSFKTGCLEMYRANLEVTWKRTENWPKSSNVQIYIFGHHFDLDTSLDFNDVFINEGKTLVADFTVAKTDID